MQYGCRSDGTQVIQITLSVRYNPHTTQGKEMPSKFDHRGDRRLHLKKPAGGMITGGRVDIVNMSLNGIGIAHDFPIKAGTQTFLEFSWAGKVLRLWVTVANCRRDRAGTGYRSGLVVQNRSESDAEYRQRVKEGLDRLRESESDLPPSV